MKSLTTNITNGTKVAEFNAESSYILFNLPIDIIILLGINLIISLILIIG